MNNVIVNLINCCVGYVVYIIPRDKISDEEINELKKLPFRLSGSMRDEAEILSNFRSGNGRFMDSDSYECGEGKWFRFFRYETHHLNVKNTEAIFCFEFTS